MKISGIIKRKLTEADWFLVIANFVPVYGVWFENWNAREIFLVYCMETIIIGFFTLVKLAIATVIRKKDWWHNQGKKTLIHGIFFMFFFLLHYGLFVWIQMSLFLNFTSINNHINPTAFQILFHPFAYLGSDAWLMLSIFVFGYGYENLSRFILDNEYRTKPFMRIMFEPYIRIFVQQFTVILGGIILVFGGGKLFIFLFAWVKIFFTVFVDYELALRKASQKKDFANQEE